MMMVVTVLIAEELDLWKTLVTEWGVGLNWHLNRNIKASVNYIESDFKLGSGNATRDLTTAAVTAKDEQVVLGRVQFSF